jgi:hypothetical protein
MEQAICINGLNMYTISNQLQCTEVFNAMSLQILGKVKGSELVGKRYVPLFPYFAHLRDGPAGSETAGPTGAFRVVADGYVTADSGTGVVHCAPAFGEDDMRVCLANGKIRLCSTVCTFSLPSPSPPSPHRSLSLFPPLSLCACMHLWGSVWFGGSGVCVCGCAELCVCVCVCVNVCVCVPYQLRI